MKNSSLDKLRGPLTVRVACLLLLTTVVGALLIIPSMAFAASGVGKRSRATTAVFLDIDQHLAGKKAIYPHDIKPKDLKLGDTLDVTVNGIAAAGKYIGTNLVTVKGQNLQLTFANSVKVPPILDLQPLSMSFIGSRDCKKNAPSNTAFVCLAKVSSRKNAQSNLNWIGYVDFSKQVVFNPPNGSLAPGQSVVVAITVPITACKPGLFYFQGLKNTHTITWACQPIA